METPGSADCHLLFQDERMTPAALIFLGEAKVGKATTLAPRLEEGGWGELEEIESWPDGGGGRDEEGNKDGPGPP